MLRLIASRPCHRRGRIAGTRLRVWLLIPGQSDR